VNQVTCSPILAELFNPTPQWHMTQLLQLCRRCEGGIEAHQSAVFRMQAKAMSHCLPLANASCLLYVEKAQRKRMVAGQTKIK